MSPNVIPPQQPKMLLAT